MSNFGVKHLSALLADGPSLPIAVNQAWCIVRGSLVQHFASSCSDLPCTDVDSVLKAEVEQGEQVSLSCLRS